MAPIKEQRKTPAIRCSATLFSIGSRTILLLPKAASAKLPSRGMVMAEGTINDAHFQAPCEPDGKGSHWFEWTTAMSKATGADAGDTVTLEIEPSQEWPEVQVPTDVKKALEAAPRALAVWTEVTPAARWDWIRWIRSTNNPDTRKKRIEVACSKLKSGMRRPCCFNRSMCTDPAVSKNGKLLEPA